MGIEVTRSTDRLFVSQRMYVLDLLKIVMIGRKPCETLIDPNHRMQEDESDCFSTIGVYRQLVSRLICCECGKLVHASSQKDSPRCCLPDHLIFEQLSKERSSTHQEIIFE